jgi:hypothetical protein
MAWTSQLQWPFPEQLVFLSNPNQQPVRSDAVHAEKAVNDSD